MSSASDTANGTLLDAAHEVARQFLQSVVVVDDRAAFGGENVDSGPAAAGTAPTAIGSFSADIPNVPSRGRRARKLRTPDTTGERKVPPEQALDAKLLIDGFAEHGVVCSVMRPDASEAPVDRALRAARRADIVVLDWELNHDSGDTTREIITRLVRDEADPNAKGRLRLIAIYSGALSLNTIAASVKKTLKQSLTKVKFHNNGPFAIVGGMVRIVVFAKPTTRYDRSGKALEELRERIVDGGALPDRLIAEFSTLTTGLVPHVALASLAALRKNTHRILGQLRADLDSAYLWHRATQARPSDAEEHLIELVIGEVRSVLDDERVGRWADIDAIRKWIAHDGRVDFSEAFGETPTRTPGDVEALLTTGTGRRVGNDTIRKKFNNLLSDKGAHRKDIAAFARDSETASRSNQHLAALMSLKSRYESPPPRLELGTIVSSGRGKSRKYWLCIQPRCDSVRLDPIGSPFPFLPLGYSDAKFDVILPDGHGGHTRLRAEKKPSTLRLVHFPAQPDGNDSVVAAPRGAGLAFRSKDRGYYRFVAELKPDHAQRIAQQVANEFSRVGLSESEWLRLWATKG